MNLPYYFWMSDIELVEVSLESLALKHCSHCSVEDQDASGYILEDAHQKCLSGLT